MLLRNYYSSLTYSCIGDTNVTEDVSTDLSPRYSRIMDGNYRLVNFPSYINDIHTACEFIYGTYYGGYPRRVWFGENTAEPTFNDYAPVSSVSYVQLNATRTSYNTTYDENTKTYTTVEMYTLTNNSSHTLNINEILYGGAGRNQQDGSFNYSIPIVREVLGDNSFTLQARESVKFELTIKYTIAEPLR